MPNYTDTELRILDVLGDGKPHQVSELCQAIDGHLTTPKTLRVHLCSMRKKMEPVGQSIINTIQFRKTYYMWVNLIARE